MAKISKQRDTWDHCHFCGCRSALNAEVNFADNAEHSLYPPNRYTRVCGLCGLAIARVALSGVAEKRPEIPPKKWKFARPDRTAEEAIFASSAASEIERIGSELAEFESAPRRSPAEILAILAELRAEVEATRDDRRSGIISDAIVQEATRQGVPPQNLAIVAHGVDRAGIVLDDDSTPNRTIISGVHNAVADYLGRFPGLANPIDPECR